MMFNKNSLIFLLCALSFSQVTLGYERYYGMTTNQNRRPYQEDRLAVVPHIQNGGDFFGIYDGHGGAETATFLQNELSTFFVKSLQENAPCKAFKQAFLEAENYALQNYSDGSTASVVYIDQNNTLYCAWVGDSRIVIEKDGVVRFATKDHKPNDPQELDRIQKYGGTIEKFGVWRVGGLALSRSIGDASIKKNYPGQVIAIPKCKKLTLHDNKNHFLVMASDGLWDVISSEEAVTFVKEQLAHKDISNLQGSIGLVHSKDLDEIVHNLQDMAIQRGSGDNITICIVYFDWSVDNSYISRIKRFWHWLWTRHQYKSEV